jgi:hypothetical protein
MNMRSPLEIAKFLECQPLILSILKQVEALLIEDCWVGAGLIRNAIWNHLHGRPVELLLDSDIDVMYWDPTNPERDLAIEKHCSRNTAIFLGQCTIKHACMNVTAMRRIATPKTRSDVGRKRQRQLVHASLAPA